MKYFKTYHQKELEKPIVLSDWLKEIASLVLIGITAVGVVALARLAELILADVIRYQ